MSYLALAMIKLKKIAADDIVKTMDIKNESIESLKLFKWRYALCQRNNQKDGFIKLNKLIAIGDWTLGPRVESAYESGRKAAIALNMKSLGLIFPDQLSKNNLVYENLIKDDFPIVF